MNGEKFLILDGSFGTMLLARGLPATAGTWLVDARCRDDA